MGHAMAQLMEHSEFKRFYKNGGMKQTYAMIALPLKPSDVNKAICEKPLEPCCT